MKDFSNTLFRCSSIGHLMTNPVSKADKEAGNLSEGAKTHCIDIYISETYNRNTDISNKYIEKGLMVEEDAITLFSRLKKTFYKKNERHLKNDFIKGTPDMFEGLEISEADYIVDVKSSWDIYTFFRTKHKDINPLYFYQLQGYMALTGAKKASLAYCLINSPAVLIEDEKKKLLWKMGRENESTAIYEEACIELEKSMIFDDIPINERVHEFTIERDDTAIQNIYNKIIKAREFLNTL